MTQGSVEEFKANWQRPEAQYCHFTRDEPVNQIQFAFRQNWLEFARIMEPLKPWAGRKALEVGAGRGTMSMYFADNGFDVSLLDACEKPLEQAHKNFERHGLKYHCHVGDAMQLPFEDESFDVVHSYGLLEHFDNGGPLDAIISEQHRVLKKGGCWIAYVPIGKPNRSFPGMNAVNEAVRLYAKAEIESGKSVYLNDNPWLLTHATARQYFDELNSFSVYPFPMIGPSVEFPFTLNPPHIELAIVAEFKKSELNWVIFDDYEESHQAFIVWGWKR